ncbi:trypsin-like peptidase domain-containing protein [Puniceicoccaceae bacterium K14]|nr:trypsin-like peptidase domain-containing protein [Puniceicoccaceae bacterium K14]
MTRFFGFPVLFLSISLLSFWSAASVQGASAKKATNFDGLLDAVVRIDVREATFGAGAKRYVTGVGSGVIMSRDGLVLTNAHVVTRQAEDIWVTLASLEVVRAELVGWDHWTDLALIQLDMEQVTGRRLGFSYASFGDSEKLKPGQVVFAVGTPHGLSRTVSKGIISNSERYFFDSRGIRGYETGFFNNWLQTDAAINPGNSGGPLVDERGRVVGINTRTYLGADNLGFAIPASTAKTVMNSLIERGEVIRSYIGIDPGFLQDLESFYDIDTNQGMLIDSVDPGSPAAMAGLRAGDIVLQINGVKLDGRFPEQIPPIRNYIANHAIGAVLQLEVKRNEDVRKFSVTTERLLSRVGEEWAFDNWGLSVREVSRAYARENQLESDKGVIVIGVQPAFPADKAKLSRGEIISKANSLDVTDIESLKKLYQESENSDESILLETLRNRRVSYKALKP